MSVNDVKVIFSKNIKRLRSSKNLTQQELGEILGLGKTTVSEWESAKKLPNAGSIQKVANFFNVPNSVLFEEPGVSHTIYEEMIHLPIVGKISCGDGVFAFEDIEGHEPTPKEWLNGGEYFYLRAKGDSMNGARIHNDDLLLIRMQPEVEEGEIAAVLIEEEAMLKRVYHRGDNVILQSENPAFPPIICAIGDVKIIGKLKKIVINL